MVDSHTAIYSNPFLCKETNLLCLINSRWVSGSLIITKSFKIQVSLFILVTATLFMFVMANVTWKFFAKLKRSGENCILGWVILGPKLMMWPVPQHLAWCGTKSVSHLCLWVVQAGRRPVWRPIRKFGGCHEGELFIGLLTFRWSPLSSRQSGKCFCWTHHCFQDYWGSVTEEEDADHVGLTVKFLLHLFFSSFLSYSIFPLLWLQSSVLAHWGHYSFFSCSLHCLCFLQVLVLFFFFFPPFWLWSLLSWKLLLNL